MSDKPVIHGADHRGVGFTSGDEVVTRVMDSIPADWTYIGDTDAPAFQNGWANAGGTLAPLRFRFLPGVDSDSGHPHIEIQGSVTGGTTGTVIFTLPITIDYQLYLAASDDAGAFVVFTVQQSGDVVYGFVT